MQMEEGQYLADLSGSFYLISLSERRLVKT
jgi:hypothetical protein